MKESDKYNDLVAGNPGRLLEALRITVVGVRAFCPYCQNDGREHKTPDLGWRHGGKGWKCHRCGEHGDWIKLVIDAARVKYPEALKIIASTYGCGAIDVEIQAMRQHDAAARAPRKRKVYKTLPDAITAQQALLGADGKGTWELYNVWRYTSTLVQVRYQRGCEKQYRPFTRTQKGWVVGAPDIKPWPLYDPKGSVLK